MCQEFKIFFHLWHGGGPNYKKEYAEWCHEQDAEWVEVPKHNLVRLTGANSIPLHRSNFRFVPASSSKSMADSNFNLALNAGHKSVFKRIIYPPNYSPVFSPKPPINDTASFLSAGVLGPFPSSPRLAPGPSMERPVLNLC